MLTNAGRYGYPPEYNYSSSSQGQSSTGRYYGSSGTYALSRDMANLSLGKRAEVPVTPKFDLEAYTKMLARLKLPKFTLRFPRWSHNKPKTRQPETRGASISSNQSTAPSTTKYHNVPSGSRPATSSSTLKGALGFQCKKCGQMYGSSNTLGDHKRKRGH